MRIGIGGWIFEPWRGTFYPDGLPHRRELEYCSRRVTAIEVNATYYRLQKPEVFRQWAVQTPDDFVFTLKGSRFATNRKELAGAGESVSRYVGQGISELGQKLGPIFWQFAPTKKFDPNDFGAFLELLPSQVDGLPLRHAVEVRHPSFATPEFVALARRFAVPIVYSDHAHYPAIADLTGDFVYARLQTGSDDLPTAYSADQLDAWAGRLNTWADGGVPDDLPVVAPEVQAERRPREVFAFIIHEGKVRAPAGAIALIERLKA
jgi:uncharacterized protein YecE (DUF72 family)